MLEVERLDLLLRQVPNEILLLFRFGSRRHLPLEQEDEREEDEHEARQNENLLGRHGRRPPVPAPVPDPDAEQDRHARHPENREEADPIHLRARHREGRLLRRLRRDPDQAVLPGEPGTEFRKRFALPAFARAPFVTKRELPNATRRPPGFFGSDGDTAILPIDTGPLLSASLPSSPRRASKATSRPSRRRTSGRDTHHGEPPANLVELGDRARQGNTTGRDSSASALDDRMRPELVRDQRFGADLRNGVGWVDHDVVVELHAVRGEQAIRAQVGGRAPGVGQDRIRNTSTRPPPARYFASAAVSGSRNAARGPATTTTLASAGRSPFPSEYPRRDRDTVLPLPSSCLHLGEAAAGLPPSIGDSPCPAVK